jgi:CheY-like chemotaxis protein
MPLSVEEKPFHPGPEGDSFRTEASDHQAEGGGPRQDGAPPPDDRPREGRATLLVVDDEPAVRRVLVMRLQLAGYRVICAEDGEEALALFHAEQPDLVVLDVMMPKLDGFAVCRRLLAESRSELLLHLQACLGWWQKLQAERHYIETIHAVRSAWPTS